MFMTNKEMIFIYRDKNGLSVYDMIPAYVRRHKEETCPQCAYYKRCRRSSFDIGGACREGLAENGWFGKEYKGNEIQKEKP